MEIKQHPQRVAISVKLDKVHEVHLSQCVKIKDSTNVLLLFNITIIKPAYNEVIFTAEFIIKAFNK